MNAVSSHEILPRLDRRDWLLLGAFALTKIVIHLATDGPGAYGYFRDELYYLDCARHLGFGYVDQPPLSIWILAATRAALGASLLAIRLPAILAGAATVVAAGLIAREMGGGRFAQALTCLLTLAAPIFLTTGSFFSMNAFDQLFWALAALLLARVMRTDDRRWWLWIGLVAGLGLENKFSMAFFAIGLAAGLAATPLRKHFLAPQLWLGAALAGALFLPHLIWQIRWGWPTLEFMHNARVVKNMPTTPASFFGGQLLLTGPAAAVLWLGGLFFAVASRRGRPWHAFAVMYAALFVVFWATNGKIYYLAPVYPPLFALGAIWLEPHVAARRWARAALAAAVALTGAALAPLSIPLLPPAALVRYQEELGIRVPQQERTHGGPLPQHLGDRLGWPELVAMIADAYQKLPPADRARCAIFVQNYGEAGAINRFGPQYGLPPAISGHVTHYLWGPGGATGEVVLAYWPKREDLENLFGEVVEVARFRAPFVMDRQNDRPLFLCRGLRQPLREVWPRLKTYF